MPKRALRFYLDTPKSCLQRLNKRRKSTNLEIQQAKDNEYEEDAEMGEDNAGNRTNPPVELTDAEFESSLRHTKQMRCIKYNQNNEIERLLLHNGSGLFYHVDHDNFPAFNVGLWAQDAPNELSNYPTCAFSIPRPIFIGDIIQENLDLCCRRPMTREKHRQRLYKTRSTYNNAIKKKTTRADEKNGIYHTSVFDMAERLLIEPDPYFNASYDYYYTGGNLCVNSEMGHIIHAVGPNLQTIEIMKLCKTEDTDENSFLQSLDKITSKEDCEIFEIQPMKSPNANDKNCFITRQRNSIAINTLTERNKLRILTQFRTKSTPFISFTQSDRDCNKLLLTTMKQHVRLYDIGASEPILSDLFKIESNGFNPSWNSIKPWRENTFLYANEYKFCLIDIRTKPEQWMAAATSVIEHNALCDHITAIKPSDFNNLFYVATNHKLHCMDIRYMKEFSFDEPEGVICRWSHQLQYSPLLIDTYRVRNHEYIALSSPIAGDLHICQLSRKKNVEKMAVTTSQRVPKHLFSSPCLPYQPPSLLEAYEVARLEGHCLQPEANLKNRLMSCTTGMSFCHPLLEGNEAPLGTLLTSNSLGDIFLRTLTKREDDQQPDVRGNENSNEMLAEYAKKLVEQKRVLNYTEIKNMKGMRKIFLCKYLNSDVKQDMEAMDDSFSENEQPAQEIPARTTPVKKKRKRLHLGRWQKSFRALHSYKDALVPDLLSIWDIDMEDEKDDVNLGNLQSNLLVKPDPDKKVQCWLETNHNTSTAMVVIPRTNASIPGHDVSNITAEAENSLLFNQTQDTIDFDNVIQSTQIADVNITQTINTSNIEELPLNTTTNSLDRSKTKKKAKKYVKGF